MAWQKRRWPGGRTRWKQIKERAVGALTVLPRRVHVVSSSTKGPELYCHKQLDIQAPKADPHVEVGFRAKRNGQTTSVRIRFLT